MPLVKMVGITRQFGTITALDNVDFEVGYQEVVGLLGDNGAGKSTLIKVLTGVHPPTSGQIHFEGQPVTMISPQEAHDLGIETVYQDLALVPLMSIARNFYLGREPVERVGPVAMLDKEAMNANTARALEHIGIHIRSAGESVGTLSGGERQSIAIGRAVHFGTKLLILDEPTSALSIGETRKVISYTQEAKKRGLSVIFITHNIHHVFEVADRFTIISHGHKVGDFYKDEVTQDEVAGMIMGEPVPERLRNRVQRPVSTRPVEIASQPGVTANGSKAELQKPMTSMERTQAKRRRQLTFYGTVVLIVALLLGMAYVQSRPQVTAANTNSGGLQMTKSQFVQDFSFNYPNDWQVERSETGIMSIVRDGNNGLQIEWDSVRNKNVSPSAPLSVAAKALQDNDFLGLKFKPGTDLKIGDAPAYAYEFDNEDQKQTGIVYLLIRQSNFYQITIKGPSDAWEKEFKPIAEAIVKSITFK